MVSGQAAKQLDWCRKGRTDAVSQEVQLSYLTAQSSHSVEQTSQVPALITEGGGQEEEQVPLTSTASGAQVRQLLMSVWQVWHTAAQGSQVFSVPS